MWSGPRNISTALMRSWESRPDTVVCDEPLYAHYLATTGRSDHPGHQETLRSGSADWRAVTRRLVPPPPEGFSIYYQKHMAHHLLPSIELDWTERLVNCLLIREPREMLTSLLEFLPHPTVEDTGLPQQVKLLEHLGERTGQAPPVVDGRDVLDDPRGVLGVLCERLGVVFDEAMLRWEPGPRDSDGPWGPYWYDKVYKTTSFGRYRPKDDAVPERLLPVLQECESLYERLAPLRLRAPRQSPPAAGETLTS
ncbi:hypothetical protein Mal64_16610 [Pseudobythopirellula maris]|uniref:Sulfotransferase family protein n=2 Tax=Pseudobythopirellula maris TaxID=2527991 RepID=A0A5C5ZP19_9BACT|nr:hypothetical protein Mal64_16610 [Pseudobythopirellula maris]